MAARTGEGRDTAGWRETARLAATPEAALVAREWVAEALTDAGWPRDASDDVALAVDEAVQNAVEHGSEPFAPLEVEVAIDDRGARVLVCDRGRPEAQVPRGAPRTPGPRSIRGRGRAIMAALADDADWRPCDGGTQVRLRFRAPWSPGD